MAIIDGRMKVGLSCRRTGAPCAGARGVTRSAAATLPILLAQGGTGATTVASTMILASLAGVRVFATGGIGGVTAAPRPAWTSAPICGSWPTPPWPGLRRRQNDSGRPYAGIPRDHGRARAGLQYQRFSRLLLPQKRVGGVNYNAPTALDVAKVAKTKWDLGLAGGMLIGNPGA